MVTLFALFIVSVKVVMPLVGQELMPPMDTGGVTKRCRVRADRRY